MTNLEEHLPLIYAILKLLIFAAVAVFAIRILVKTKIVSFIADMHSESATKASWMRGMGTIIIVSALLIAAYQIYSTGQAQEWLIIGLVTIGITGKAMQKHTELKSTNNKSNL